jgi:hypothetical protein
MNVVERFFAKLTKRPLPKRVLLDRVEQPAAIRRFPAKTTANYDHCGLQIIPAIYRRLKRRRH